MSKPLTLEEVRDAVASEIGYSITPEGYADSGDRSYGGSDDYIIDFVYALMAKTDDS